jgi:REP-associated tyrosine transposase
MAHSYSQIHIHLVFSTKDRRNSIAKEWQPRLWAYLGGIWRNHEILALAVGGTENHVHLLILLPPKLSLAKAVALLKANSSKWMGECQMQKDSQLFGQSCLGNKPVHRR